MIRLKTLIAFAAVLFVVAPCDIVAQKKGKVAVPKMVTANDSVSYSFGVGMGNSLAPSLTRVGVLADTAQIRITEQAKIDAATTSAEKTRLTKQLKASIDSANAANEKNKAEFYEGIKTIIDDKRSQAYNTGLSIGGQIKHSALSFSKDILEGEENFNMAAFLYGILSSSENATPLFSDPEALSQGLIENYQKEKQKQAMSKAQAEYDAKLDGEKAFFEQNKKDEEVVELPSGLQYKILKEGTGVIPQNGDLVTVHYKGSLLDGTVFDSSIDRGEPAQFNVGQLVVGWNEALMLMPAGSKWMLYIPFSLGYGERDMGTIPPFSTLIFEIELISVDK